MFSRAVAILNFKMTLPLYVSHKQTMRLAPPTDVQNFSPCSKIFPVKARKTHDMESCKEDDIEENIELPKESLQEIELVSIG